MNAHSQPVPVLDFRSMLSLQADDTLDGYRLCLGGFIHVNLQGIEQAYLEADAAGLHAGVLVQFNDNTRHLGVVTGRNLSVMSNFYTPSRYPVCIHSSRGLYEYSASDASPIPVGVRAAVMLNNAEVLEGRLDCTGLSNDGDAFIVLDGQQLMLRDIAVLERLPDLH